MNNTIPTQIKGFHDLLGYKYCVSIYIWLIISTAIPYIIYNLNIRIHVPYDYLIIPFYFALLFLAFGLLILVNATEDGNIMIERNTRKLSRHSSSIITEVTIFKSMIISILFANIFSIIMALVQ